jgi:hypothetical protein
VEYHKKTLKLTTEEALAKAEESCSLSQMWRILDCPPEEVHWADLEDLAAKAPERALLRWEEVKQAAREELQSGHRAASALEGYFPDAWECARFLAIRDDLIEALQPRNGVERQLIDQMAEARTHVLYWQRRLALRASVEPLRVRREVEERGDWETPRVSQAEDMDQSAAMVDRFNKIYVRTLRALCNLRKGSLAVVVQNAGQVNVGGQQVNVAR